MRITCGSKGRGSESSANSNRVECCDGEKRKKDAFSSRCTDGYLTVPLFGLKKNAAWKIMFTLM